ncbi:Gfo/Idh/MocA family oxidoreductase [Acidimicrobiaceae bacterium]|nr:Gfo/Idh/MocA family oxidoreductase [Acidimicrobiaceae bacterium]
MKILVVGNGQHTNRRILPSLRKIAFIKSIYVADRNSENEYFKKNKKVNILNYENILKNDTEFDFVIISTYPSSHLLNVKELKNRTKNFIIEKPITNDLDQIQTKSFMEFYKKNNLKEGLMFFHHPFWKFLNSVISKYDFQKLESNFTIPNNIDKNNFRLNKQKGGSSILDNGIYPISLISELGFSNLNVINKRINYNKKYSIDISGQALLESENIKKISIKWGLGVEYNNFVKLVDKKKEIYIPFFFSKPEQFKPIIYIKGEKNIEYRNIDQFRKMYSDFFLNKNIISEYTNFKSLNERYKLVKILLND